MNATVLLNAAAGVRPGGVRAETARVTELFGAQGVAAHVREVPGPELCDAAREAVEAGAEVVVVGGGDGTVSAGAAAVAGTGAALGVLPLGTLNHFARDAGIPLELEDAVRTIATGCARAVDVGQGNERVFVNNSSIGLYAQAVADREARRAATGAYKWVAAGRAAIETLWRFKLTRVTLELPEGALRVTTPLVFIGNNRYETRLPALGRRAALDGGELWVYLARGKGRLGFVRLALQALAGRLEEGGDMPGLGVTELVVESRRRAIRVAFDGEVCRMAPPIRYRVRPRALRVMVPREAAEAPPA